MCSSDLGGPACARQRMRAEAVEAGDVELVAQALRAGRDVEVPCGHALDRTGACGHGVGCADPLRQTLRTVLMTSNESERLPAVIEMGRVQYAPPLYAPPFSPQEDDPEEAKLPLSQYLSILKRYRWRILTFAVLVVFVTLVVSLRLTPIYEATATIDVDRGTPSDVVGQDSGDRKSTRLNSSH